MAIAIVRYAQVLNLEMVRLLQLLPSDTFRNGRDQAIVFRVIRKAQQEETHGRKDAPTDSQTRAARERARRREGRPFQHETSTLAHLRRPARKPNDKKNATKAAGKEMEQCENKSSWTLD